MLACHYLSIRLPAEITLPHRDYPQPTIFSLLSSYKHGDVPFPGTADLHPNNSIPFTTKSSPSSANSSRFSAHTLPRARPLYLDKPLHVLAKDDRLGHTLFLEGIGLLAYNIAWACCSQGVPMGDKTSFEDMFSIGRNLYNLLIGNQLPSNPAGRVFSASPAMSPSSNTRGTAGNSNNSNAKSGGNESVANGKTSIPASIGLSSHGATHTYLSDKTVQNFKILNPNRLADRLRTKLSSDSTMPDWEVLEDDAWAVDDDDQNKMEDGVLNRVVVSPPAAHQSERSSGRNASSTGPNGGSSSNTNRGSSAGTSGGASGKTGFGGVVVGSHVPEQRLYGVESVATVFAAMDDTVANIDLKSQRLTAPPTADRSKGSGTSGWTKLRNRQ